jgi:DDE superfamily endonuclease
MITIALENPECSSRSAPRNWLGDKGYIGNNMLTPFRKPEGGELLDWQKEFNRQINKIRYVIEQVITNFKTWRIMHTTIPAGCSRRSATCVHPSGRSRGQGPHYRGSAPAGGGQRLLRK